MKTNQIKLRQSCRKMRAIKAGDFVKALRMTRRRQMQRRNKISQIHSEFQVVNESQVHCIMITLFKINDCVALHLHSPSQESELLQVHQHF